MFYCFKFTDGYIAYAKGFSRYELRVEEHKHGKLISKTRI